MSWDTGILTMCAGMARSGMEMPAAIMVPRNSFIRMLYDIENRNRSVAYQVVGSPSSSSFELNTQFGRLKIIMVE